MFTSIIPQRKGQFTITGGREVLAEHLRKVGASIGKLDIDVYDFRIARHFWKWEAYLIIGSIRNIGGSYIIDYHIRNHRFIELLWWIAIPGNMLLLLFSDADVAALTGMSLLPSTLRYFIYFTFMWIVMKLFSWLVLSDMAIAERMLCDIPPIQAPKEALIADPSERPNEK